MEDAIDLIEIRRRLTLFLKHYEQARGRADFLEAALGIQTALEKALDAQLSPQQAYELSFAGKFAAALPNLATAWNVDELAELRNRYAHPYTTYGLEAYRRLAEEFVGLTLAAWPRLFGGAPPGVAAPEALSDDDRLLQEAALAIKAQKSELETAEARIQSLTQQLAAARATPKRVIPWRSLALGLLLALPVVLLAGMAVDAAARRPVPWPLALLPALLALGFALLAARHLWRFGRAVGLLRLAAGVAIGLLLATLLLTPFTSPSKGPAARTGDALERVLAGLGRFALAPAAWLVDRGSDLGALAAVALTRDAPDASNTAVPLPAAAEPTAEAVETAAPATPAGEPAVVPPPTPTDEPLPTATPRPQIQVGGRVLVRTEGNPLMGRALATTDAEIVARFDDGATLAVVEGPQEADGLTWWRVQGDAGAGWSAADYLEPVAE